MTVKRDPSLLIQRSALLTALQVQGLSGDQANEVYWQLAMMSQDNKRLVGRSRKFTVKAERSKLGVMAYLEEALKTTTTSSGIRPFITLDFNSSANKAKLMGIAATIGLTCYSNKRQDSLELYKQFVDIAINVYKCRNLQKLLVEKDKVANGFTAKLKLQDLDLEDKALYYELVNLWVDLNALRTGIEEEDLRAHANKLSSVTDFLELHSIVKQHKASADVWLHAQFDGLKNLDPTSMLSIQAMYTEEGITRYIKYRTKL